MPVNVTMLLGIAAFICTIVSAVGYCPLWVATLLLCVLELLRVMPAGH